MSCDLKANNVVVSHIITSFEQQRSIFASMWELVTETKGSSMTPSHMFHSSQIDMN